jgi:hypothetical protein
MEQLYNDTESITNVIILSEVLGTMIVVRVRKASVVAYLKVLSQHSLGQPDERHETLHSG